MTETEHDLAPILRAIADGKEIQGREAGSGGKWQAWPFIDDLYWNPLSNPESWEWRVAPIEYERWLNIYNDSDVRSLLFTSKFEADMAAAPGRLACIMISFTEGEGV